MKGMVARAAVGLVVCVVAGCGSGQGQDGVIKERLRCWNEATDIIATIRDESSASKARPRLDEILQRLVALNRKAKTLRPASEEEEIDLRLKNQDALKTANEKLNEQMARASLVPGGAEVVYEFNQKVHQVLN